MHEMVAVMTQKLILVLYISVRDVLLSLLFFSSFFHFSIYEYGHCFNCFAYHFYCQYLLYEFTNEKQFETEKIAILHNLI